MSKMGWRLVALSIGLALSSCAPIDPTAGISLTADTQVANDATPTTSSITSTYSPSATSTPLSTPEPTIILSPTIYATPPAFADTLLQEDVLFGPGIVPDCELPCWNGLRVGSSTVQDVINVYVEIIGYENATMLFAGEPNETSGLIHHGDIWRIEEDPLVSLGMTVWIDSSSRTLQGISFRVHGTKFKKYITPALIISELGPPEAVYVKYEESGEVPKGVVRLAMLYATKGMVFNLMTTSGRNVNGLIDICFADEHWINEGFPYGSTDVQIIEPFDEYVTPTALQQTFAMGWTDSSFKPLDELTRMPIEDLAVLIQNGECVHIQLDG